MKKILLFVLLSFGFHFSNAQCAYSGTPLTQVGTAFTFCIDNSSNTLTTASINAGQFAVVNVVKGFSYTFSVGNVFALLNENLTILDASTNANVAPTASATAASGASITWTASISGQIKILLSKGACINDNTIGGALTLVLNAIGNTQDSQTAFGTDTWVGHVYNYIGNSPAGGTSPNTPTVSDPFTAANYVGFYNIATESIAETESLFLKCTSSKLSSINLLNTSPVLKSIFTPPLFLYGSVVCLPLFFLSKTDKSIHVLS